MDPAPHLARGRTLLGVAAESLARGRAETVVDVLHGRAFRHYREALRQYLALRLEASEVGRALVEVRAVAAATPAEEIVAQPGIRARLFRLAKAAVDRRPEDARAARPRFRSKPKLSSATESVLGEVRRWLFGDDETRVILELHFARELSVDEIAFVEERPKEVVEAALAEAVSALRAKLGTQERGATPLRTAVVDALALEPVLEVIEYEEVDAGPPPLEGGTVLGERYRIEHRVGSGAFSDVYVAFDTEVRGHKVALKLLHQPATGEDARARALRELQLIASVFHPSLVQFKDHGWHEGRLWFVMPWYEGESLEARIAREPLDRAEAHRIFRPLALALGAMHRAGIRHQDVKPDNIFLAKLEGAGPDGHDVLPVLLDLGVAAKDAEMIVAGTPTYFAPEVASQFAAIPSDVPITARADVFSLALSLRNALEPEQRDEVAAGAVEAFIEERARSGATPTLRREHAFLRTHFERWLARDPNDRPTADELAATLDVLIAPEVQQARRAAVLRWVVPTVVAAVALLASAVYALGTRAREERLEAQRAREGEAAVREDLLASHEQRRLLEEAVDATRERYVQSQLTRDELTNRLARTESERNALGRSLSAARRRAGDLNEELTGARSMIGELERRAATLEADATRTARELESSRALLATSTADLTSTRRELDSQRAEVARLAARLDEAEAARDAAVRERDIAVAETSRAESERVRALATESALRIELDATRRRIAELERASGVVPPQSRVSPPRGPIVRPGPVSPLPGRSSSAEDATHPAGGVVGPGSGTAPPTHNGPAPTVTPSPAAVAVP